MSSSQLPTIASGNSSGDYLVPAYHARPSHDEYTAEAPPVPLSHYFWILRRHQWKIILFVLTCVTGTLVVSSRLQPIYESTAAIDVDRMAPAGIVGHEADQAAVSSDADQFLATQIKLIQSDSVLRPVAERFGLWEQENQLRGLSPEQVQVLKRAPVTLKRLRIARPPNTYVLGISYRSPNPQLAADVANGIAKSYLNHTYQIRIQSSASLSTFMTGQMDELKAKMERSGMALAQFERELNVINPEEKTNILSTRLLQLNQEYTAAQAERVRKEAAYNSMKTGMLEAVQISTQGESLAKLQERLNDAQQRFAQLQSTYGSNHPAYRKAASELSELQKQFDDTRRNIAQRINIEYTQALNREQMLKKTVEETKAEYDHINANSFQYQELKREAEADKTLYEELIRKIREAGINAGFQNDNIRIADLARPGASPVFPKVALNLIVAIVLSTILAVGGVILSDTLDTTLRDPEETSRYLRTDVIGIVPSVRNSLQLDSMLSAPDESKAVATSVALATNGNGDYRKTDYRKGYYRTVSGFEEAVRTIRTTILLSDLDSRIRSMLITSANPAEGKTTIAVHLAIANADQGQKTLIVDGDLRRPNVHRKFRLTPQMGLTNVLTGEAAWRDVIIRPGAKPNLHILPAGPPSHRAADLIGPKLGELLDEVGKEYSLVVLDAPPLLGFAEPLQMATCVDGVVIVGRAGETKRKAVSTVVSALNRVHSNVIGIVLNHMKRHTSENYSYYGYNYGYRYYGAGAGKES